MALPENGNKYKQLRKTLEALLRRLGLRNEHHFADRFSARESLKRLLDLTEGEGAVSEHPQFALPDQAQEVRDILCDLLRIHRRKVEADQALVAANQLLDVLRRERVVDVAGAEEDDAAERSQQLEAFASDFP